MHRFGSVVTFCYLAAIGGAIGLFASKDPFGALLGAGLVGFFGLALVRKAEQFRLQEAAKPNRFLEREQLRDKAERHASLRKAGMEPLIRD